MASSTSGGAKARKDVLYLPVWYDGEVHRGIALYAREQGWSVASPPRHTAEIPFDWSGDGIITLLGRGNDPLVEFVNGFAGRVPMVNLDGTSKDARVAYVLQDNKAIGREGARYLLDRGLRRFVFVSVWGDTFTLARRQGFRDAVESHQDSFTAIETAHGSDYAWSRKGQEWLVQELSRTEPPFGLMTANDVVSLQVLNACAAADLRVPEQVAVLGVDNDPLCCELAPVPLSSVDNNRKLQGYEAARMLDRLMQGDPPPAEPFMIEPLGVVTRHSTNVFAVIHEGVAKALVCIQERYYDPDLRSAEVVRASGMSRSRLHDAFTKHVGCSVSEMIRQQRINGAKRLLRDTDRKAEQVALQSGFTSAERMSKVFKRALGKSPRAYRDETRDFGSLI